MLTFQVDQGCWFIHSMFLEESQYVLVALFDMVRLCPVQGIEGLEGSPRGAFQRHRNRFCMKLADCIRCQDKPQVKRCIGRMVMDKPGLAGRGFGLELCRFVNDGEGNWTFYLLDCLP